MNKNYDKYGIKERIVRKEQKGKLEFNLESK